MKLLLSILIFLFATAASAQEPVLRLETGMHTAMVRRIAVDAGGRWLVSASDDKTARVWDLARIGEGGARPARVLRPPIGDGHEGELYAVALSPDGRTVACGGWTGWDREKKASIYLFDRSSGEMTKRLAGFPNIVKGVAFSPDGRFLAVTLGAGKGLAVLRTIDWRPVFLDPDYGDDAYGVAFDRSGRLATTAWDGFVRLYGTDFRLLARARFPERGRPCDLAFSPDGARLAVGNADSAAVAVFSTEGLRPIAAATAPDTAAGALPAVAWSGSTLLAAGSYGRPGEAVLRSWGDGGAGKGSDRLLAFSSVQQLLPLPDGRLAYAGAGPEIGVAGNGATVRLRLSALADPRGDLQTTDDGSALLFRGADGKRHLFAVRERNMEPAPKGGAGFLPPVTAAPGMETTGWQNGSEPALNGLPLGLDPFETSRSLAITAGGELVIGTDWALRGFDREGKVRWKVPVPGGVRGVNASANGVVVASLGDGTIRWYCRSDGRELLAFFPHADGRRWVLWTPSGYYDAAPGGEELIGWHLNAGADRAADFFGVARFRGDFYRPELIAAVLGKGDERAVAAPREDGRSGRRTGPAPKRLPPVAVITSPENLSLLTGEVALLEVAVRSPAGEPITGLKVLAGGRPVAAGVEGVAGRPDRRLVRVPVGPGEVELAVIAENRNGAGEPALIRLRREAVAPEEFSVQPRLYILAVGVSAYPDRDLGLAFAAKDARDFAAQLARQKGGLYRDVTVRVITDAAATREAVLDGLEWLQRQTTARDVAVLFLAGHGVTDANGVYYYLPVNADTGRLKSTGIIFTEIRNSLMALAGKAILFVDTCHSGSIMGGRRAVADINAVINELASAEVGTVVFASSTGRQYSLEDEAWGNGAFTKALLEGLSGKADFTGTGRITINMLDLYLAERVKELTGGRQTPTTAKPQTVQDFPIAVVR